MIVQWRKMKWCPTTESHVDSLTRFRFTVNCHCKSEKSIQQKRHFFFSLWCQWKLFISMHIITVQNEKFSSRKKGCLFEETETCKETRAKYMELVNWIDMRAREKNGWKSNFHFPLLTHVIVFFFWFFFLFFLLFGGSWGSSSSGWSSSTGSWSSADSWANVGDQVLDVDTFKGFGEQWWPVWLNFNVGSLQDGWDFLALNENKPTIANTHVLATTTDITSMGSHKKKFFQLRFFDLNFSHDFKNFHGNMNWHHFFNHFNVISHRLQCSMITNRWNYLRFLFMEFSNRFQFTWLKDENFFPLTVIATSSSTKTRAE